MEVCVNETELKQKWSSFLMIRWSFKGKEQMEQVKLSEKSKKTSESVKKVWIKHLKSLEKLI